MMNNKMTFTVPEPRYLVTATLIRDGFKDRNYQRVVRRRDLPLFRLTTDDLKEKS